MYALERLCDAMIGEFELAFKKLVKRLPDWVYKVKWCYAITKTTVRDALEYARRFSLLKKYIAQFAIHGQHHAFMFVDMSPFDPPEQCTIERALATARLSFGSLLEDYAAFCGLKICEVHFVPGSDATEREFSQLCSDGYYVALWTDMHAVYIHEVLSERVEGLECAHRNCGSPCVHTTTSYSALPRLSAALSGSITGKPPMSDHARILVTLIMRCVQSGARGWDGALNAALSNEFCRNVCRDVLISGLCAMHPNLHPGARPSWETRRLINVAIKHHIRDVSKIFKQSSVAAKECLRIYAAVLLDDAQATRAALDSAGQHIGALRLNPASLPHASMQAAAHALVAAGVAIAEFARSRAGDGLTDATVVRLIQTHLGSEVSKTKRKAFPAPGSSLARSKARYVRLSYSSGWLTKSMTSGAGQNAGRKRRAEAVEGDGAPADESEEPSAPVAHAVVGATTSLIDVVKEIAFRCFKPSFTCFWLQSSTQGYRPSRLDPPQYDALHHNCPFHMLCATAPDADLLAVQRVALRRADADVLSIFEVAEALGVARGHFPVSSSVEQSIQKLMMLSAREASCIIHFGRIAALKSKMTAFALGPKTMALQLAALSRRYELRVKTPEEARRLLPPHAFQLFYCNLCNSVANACSCSETDPHKHNELGISQTMLHVGAPGCPDEIRCAKRSSAAVRTAISKEAEAQDLRVEMLPIDDEKLLGALETHERTQDVPKLRRDLKSCVEQARTAVACGDESTISIDILGRAARVAGTWHGICAYCGCVMRIGPARRFRDQICCLRCDAGMVGLAPKSAPELSLTEQIEQEIGGLVRPNKLPCRYCGRPQPATSSGVSPKFKIVHSPIDSGGRNASIPPPLRISAFCTAHYRSWLEWACKELDMRVIFSHIAEKAIPAFGADKKSQGSDADATNATNPKRVIAKKHKQLNKRMRIAMKQK